jgi:hypothetical protein
VQPLWKTIWRLLKKLNIDLLYDPVILLLEIYPKNGTQFIIKAPALTKGRLCTGAIGKGKET